MIEEILGMLASALQANKAHIIEKGMHVKLSEGFREEHPKMTERVPKELDGAIPQMDATYTVKDFTFFGGEPCYVLEELAMYCCNCNEPHYVPWPIKYFDTIELPAASEIESVLPEGVTLNKH